MEDAFSHPRKAELGDAHKTQFGASLLSNLRKQGVTLTGRSTTGPPRAAPG